MPKKLLLHIHLMAPVICQERLEIARTLYKCWQGRAPDADTELSF